MEKLFKTLLLLPFLSACGGSESESSHSPATLSDVVGVWDMTETSEYGEDVYYMSITEYGDLIFYDYDGDTYDQGQDCYFEIDPSMTLTDLGEGKFELSNGTDYTNISLSTGADSLIMTVEGVSSSLPATSLQVSDLTPLCFELYSSYDAFSGLQLKSNQILNVLK